MFLSALLDIGTGYGIAALGAGLAALGAGVGIGRIGGDAVQAPSLIHLSQPTPPN